MVHKLADSINEGTIDVTEHQMDLTGNFPNPFHLNIAYLEFIGSEHVKMK